METAAANTVTNSSAASIGVELLLRRLRSLNVLARKKRGDKQAILDALKTLRLFALNSWPTEAQLPFVRAVLLRLIPRTFQVGPPERSNICGRSHIISTPTEVPTKRLIHFEHWLNYSTIFSIQHFAHGIFFLSNHIS